MNIYFSGRLLTANDLGAEQEASVQPGAGAAAPATSSDLHAGTPGETLARSLPASRFDAVALNPQPLPPKEVDSHIKSLEDKLNSVGDDAQLANVDLQNILQKQQQTLQMMSNISKLVHDTMLSVIRKIGG